MAKHSTGWGDEHPADSPMYTLHYSKSAPQISPGADRGAKSSKVIKSNPIGFRFENGFFVKGRSKRTENLRPFFVGKIPYCILMPATSFCDTKSKRKKLMGVTGAYMTHMVNVSKTFYFHHGHPPAPRKLLPVLVPYICARNSNVGGNI